MTTFNENFDKLASFNALDLAPTRQFAVAALDSLEKIARKNYDVFGDFVDFAVAQAKLPVDATEPQEFFARQVANTQAFAEQLNTRMSEYAELGSEFQAAATQAAAADVAVPAAKKAPARKASGSSRRKAA